MNRLATILAFLAAITATAPAAVAATTCEDLALIVLPDTVITDTERVTSGSFDQPGGAISVPTMCRVSGIVSPAIRFEVWLPEAWNGRFQAVGGGGLAGVISYSAMAEAVTDGYASASTDTGHQSSDSTWLSDPQRREDYGYRAIHEMTVRAKAVIDAHYGTPPAYSYFNGCSTGGRQGLMEAQRYPGDYNGIISGAPVNRFTHLHIGQLWTAHSTLKTPGAILAADDFALLSEAAVGQCDAVDQVSDGIIRDPSMCMFNPRDLECSSSNRGACLAGPQVRAAEMIYGGATNPRTGAQIYPGLMPGGEGVQPGNPGWSSLMNGETPFFFDTAVIGGMAFEDSEWDWRTFDFDSDVEIVDSKLYGTLNAVNPDLRDFDSEGGKLLMYHGWNDPGVMPLNTVSYFDSIVDYTGKTTPGDAYQNTTDFARLFMLPGVGHCRGGVGPDQADFMSPIVSWVEDGVAPERITVSAVRDGMVTMTRPICSHPQVAVYSGQGDTNEEANFECAAP
jgi:feruloyl esterase